MQAIIRVDSSELIGTGHVMRCLALAEELRERNWGVVFLCRELSGHVSVQLQSRGFEVRFLPRPPSEQSGAGYARWLGCTQEQDAADTRMLLRELPSADLLVVDHYGIDSRWEHVIAPEVGNILVIDDLGNRSHSCNILLDQNYRRANESPYAGLVNERCEILSGPRYALLRTEFRNHARKRTGRSPPFRRLLISFGGVDRANASAAILGALDGSRIQPVEVEVVLGPGSVHLAQIAHVCGSRDHCRLLHSVPNMAPLLESADLVVGSGGGSLWERLYLGVPCLAYSVAPNQDAQLHALGSASMLSYAGAFAGRTAAQLDRDLKDAWENAAQLIGQARRGMSLFDAGDPTRALVDRIQEMTA